MNIKVGDKLRCIKEDDNLFPIDVNLQVGYVYPVINIHDDDRTNKWVMNISGTRVAYRDSELPIYFDTKSILRSKFLNELGV